MRGEYLDLFSLHENATGDELAAAYRRLVKRWHPDQFANDERRRGAAEAHMKLVNQAYRVLKTELRNGRHRRGRTAGGLPGPLAAFESEIVLTYLPLLVLAAILNDFAGSAIGTLSLLLAIAWSLMAWRVAHDARLPPKRRVVWVLAMMFTAGVAVPLYFRR